ncbi:hypothetical protein PFICI_01405 [Pestalotiopsis fici W106-1]|uniref:Zn(2)-C6 fungal-type domain-containing protein n=1 Tax=Pestalotiopsis fici (strain W106-1 / CGMCC3.15140) TaxID=1229662 RepID=W3XPY5_PESFW|nr:uncharacterized protein PFICI_01405 [Pestalotiopsis fici W106-1]ETS87577.1 hypothetical protein PFICI_01405 [Pestalotiopsis fici W106-1]
MSEQEKPQRGYPHSARHQHSSGDSDDDTSMSFGIGRSRISSCFASICPPCSTSDPPPAYSGVPSTPYGYEARSALYQDAVTSAPSQSWSGTQPPASAFAYDDSPNAPYFPDFPVLQPTRTQPSTRHEEMTYNLSPPERKYLGRPDVQRIETHVTNLQSRGGYDQSSYTSPNVDSRGQMPGVGFLPADGDEAQVGHQSNLDIVSSHQRAPPSKRGPFKNSAERERTAETRKIGSCIRCRMQRIRCEINPDDKIGTCLTCSRVTSTKTYRLPCLRYKITDVRLFKPGNVKGHEWTRRWTEGIADDISNWASPEVRMLCVTEGYGTRPVRLRVREFIPQEGDKLERSWVYQGTKKSVRIPAFAIVNLDEAKTIYTEHIANELKECCRNVLSDKHQLLRGTYGFALNLMLDPSTDPKEKDLLSKAFRLWMAIRMTTKSTLIVGDERLGMDANIMDDTSPIKGKIPLPPVMGAQIELILIGQLQTKWRREMLDQLQTMTQQNNHSTWLTIYLTTFILLHNVSLLCQHDHAYAVKHGMKDSNGKQASNPSPSTLHKNTHRANILLAYWHYCNKGIYPFSGECSEAELSSLAKLDVDKIKFVHQTRNFVEKTKEHWQRIRRGNEYENDMFFISQLFEEKWIPEAPLA